MSDMVTDRPLLNSQGIILQVDRLSRFICLLSLRPFVPQLAHEPRETPANGLTKHGQLQEGAMERTIAADESTDTSMKTKMVKKKEEMGRRDWEVVVSAAWVREPCGGREWIGPGVPGQERPLKSGIRCGEALENVRPQFQILHDAVCHTYCHTLAMWSVALALYSGPSRSASAFSPPIWVTRLERASLSRTVSCINHTQLY